MQTIRPTVSSSDCSCIQLHSAFSCIGITNNILNICYHILTTLNHFIKSFHHSEHIYYTINLSLEYFTRARSDVISYVCRASFLCQSTPIQTIPCPWYYISLSATSLSIQLIHTHLTAPHVKLSYKCSCGLYGLQLSTLKRYVKFTISLKANHYFTLFSLVQSLLPNDCRDIIRYKQGLMM